MFGDILRAARRDAGLNQQDLEERTDVRQYNISKYETGKSIPSDEVIEELAAAMGAEAEPLLEAAEQERRKAGEVSGYVSHHKHIEPWRNAVAAGGLPSEATVNAMSLPIFLNRDLWIAVVSTEAMAAETQRDPEAVGEGWQPVIDAGFVERVQPTEPGVKSRVQWVFRLRFPDGD